MKQCDFTIVAIVCDFDGGNRKLFNELDVNKSSEPDGIPALVLKQFC